MQNLSNVLTEINRLFDRYDKKADKTKKGFERVWKAGIFTGVIAVVIFAYLTVFRKCHSELFTGLILPIVEVLLIVFSFIALSQIVPKLKKKFIASRRSAEILRLHQLFIENNIPLKPSTSFQLEEYTLPEDILVLENKSRHTSKQEVLKEYPENIVEKLNEFVKAQQKYHRQERIEKFHKREHRLELALQIILWVFISIVGLKLLVELFLHFKNDSCLTLKDLKFFLYLFKFSVIFLPPLYAALEGFYYFSEWKRNIKFSERVNAEYEVLLGKIEDLKKQQNISKYEINNIANELFDIFHEDNLNWYRWYLSKKIGARI